METCLGCRASVLALGLQPVQWRVDVVRTPMAPPTLMACAFVHGLECHHLVAKGQ